MDIKKNLGKKIQEFRKLGNLTQEQLAEIIGIDVVSLSKIETGRNYPTSENLEKICNALYVLPHESYNFEPSKAEDKVLKELQKNIRSIKNNKKKLSTINNIIKELL